SPTQRQTSARRRELLRRRSHAARDRSAFWPDLSAGAPGRAPVRAGEDARATHHQSTEARMTLPRWLTGGRPMRRICFCFRDVVTGYPIFLWEDRYGRTWMAHRAWAWFRLKPSF